MQISYKNTSENDVRWLYGKRCMCIMIMWEYGREVRHTLSRNKEREWI